VGTADTKTIATRQSTPNTRSGQARDVKKRSKPVDPLGFLVDRIRFCEKCILVHKESREAAKIRLSMIRCFILIGACEFCRLGAFLQEPRDSQAPEAP